MSTLQDRKGNGIANKTSDECYTPEYAVKLLLKYIPKSKTIWCPFDKEWSAYVKVFRQAGYNVIYSHIEDGKDFFKYEPENYDLIVSNPPFSIADDILERLYKMDKPFMMLLPLKYLQAKRRCEMFLENGIQLLTFDSRIGYFTKGEMDKPKEGNSQASSYFCWKILPKDFIIERLNKTGFKPYRNNG